MNPADDSRDAALRALARRRAEQGDAHDAAVASGDDPRLAPPDETEQAAFLAALLDPAASGAAAPSNVVPFPAPAARGTAQAASNRTGSRTLSWVAFGALAAGVLTFVAIRRPEPLPAYSLRALQAGAQAFRSDPATPTWQLVPGTRFDLVLEPGARVEGTGPARPSLVLSAYVASKGLLTAFTPEVEADAGGAFRVRGVVGQTFTVSPGDHAFVFVLARPDDVPAAEAVAAARARPEARRDFVLIENPFHSPAPEATGVVEP